MAADEPTRLRTATSRALPVIAHVPATRADAVTLAPVVAELRHAGAFRQLVVPLAASAGSTLTDEVLAEHGLAGSDRGAAATGDSGSATAGALLAAEPALEELAPAVVVIGGASDAALGWALAATKLQIPIAKVEAGLRDFDWRGAEEVNRVLLDTMADTLFAPTGEAASNLVREGVAAARVHVVGSTAVDSLRRVRRRARTRAAWRELGLERGAYVLVMLHREAGPDEEERVARVVEGLAELAGRAPVVLPLDSRTRRRLDAMGDLHRLRAAGVRCIPPVSHLDSVSLQWGAGAVVTDSGTVQDETSALGVACFTLRSSTERAITLTHGTNQLLGAEPRDLSDVTLARVEPTPCAIPLWDGRAAGRIARWLVATYALVRVPRAS